MQNIKNQAINLNHLYSAGGIASAWHSNDAPEYNNAVVNRSGPTAVIIGGSVKNQLILGLRNEVMNKVILEITVSNDSNSVPFKNYIDIHIYVQESKSESLHKIIRGMRKFIVYELPIAAQKVLNCKSSKDDELE